MKDEKLLVAIEKLKHSIYGVGFFLAAVYLLYHKMWLWGIFNVVAMTFQELLAIDAKSEEQEASQQRN